VPERTTVEDCKFFNENSREFSIGFLEEALIEVSESSHINFLHYK